MSEAPAWSEMISLPNILPSELVAGQTLTSADANAEHPEETTSLIKQAETACTGSKASGMAPPAPKMRTTVVLALAFVLERLDEMILSAVYTPLGEALHASPSQLGSLTLCRALVQALVSPLSGLLGDRCNRIHVVAAGTLLWGGMTAAIGMATTLQQAMAWAAFTGVGLAMVVPAAMSIVADYYQSAVRGRAFGALFTVAALGGMAGGFFATSVSGQQPGGVEGWRFAFFVTAGMAAAAAVLNLGLGVDPRLTLRGRARCADRGFFAPAVEAMRELGASLWTVGRIRSFQVIVLQGVVGGMPWNAIGYATMWAQALGFSDMAAATLTALFWGGTALGNLIGGLVGDLLVKPLPDAGRQLTCQISIATGLPLAAVLLKALPHGDGSAGGMDGLTPAYGTVMFLLGTLVSWPQTQNSCFFAEVVPESLRSSVYAFDRCFEGALGALSAPLVGIIAERCFGYVSSWQQHAPDPARQLSNAQALGNGLLVCLVVPWGLQFLAYLLLYASFPADRDASIDLERQRRLGAAAQGGTAEGSAAAAAARGYVPPPPRDWQAHGQSGCIVKRASDGSFAGV